MLRPRARVLPDAAVVPAANLQPAPAQLSHVLRDAQPFHYVAPEPGQPADGHLAAGTELLLLDDGPHGLCQVLTAQGLCVYTARAGLQALGTGPGQ